MAHALVSQGPGMNVCGIICLACIQVLRRPGPRSQLREQMLQREGKRGRPARMCCHASMELSPDGMGEEGILNMNIRGALWSPVPVSLLHFHPGLISMPQLFLVGYIITRDAERRGWTRRSRKQGWTETDRQPEPDQSCLVRKMTPSHQGGSSANGDSKSSHEQTARERQPGNGIRPCR